MQQNDQRDPGPSRELIAGSAAAGAPEVAVVNDEREREDFGVVRADSAWQRFWAFDFARCLDKRSAGYEELGVSEAPVSSRQVATWNKVLTLFFGTCGFGAGDLIATAVLHSLILYSGTRMSRFINTGSTVGDSMINGAIGGATGFLIPLPFAILGTSIGYRYNRPQLGSLVGHTIGWGIHIAGDVYLLGSKTPNNPQAGAVTYDSSLTAPSANALVEKIVLATDDTNKNYTIHSISFTGNNRQAVQVVSPAALLSQNGTHFNITFQTPVLVYNNQTQEIFLEYANPQAIVPPVKDVTVAIYDVAKGNETSTTSYSAPIHGLDLTARQKPGIFDWQTVFSNTTTVSNANRVIIGPLNMNADGSYSLYNATRDVPRYHDVLQYGVKNPAVDIELYTSGFGPGTGFDWSMGANNETVANIHNNTLALFNLTDADGIVFDAEGGWTGTPIPVNGTYAANILQLTSKVGSDKRVSFTLPPDHASDIWPTDSLDQVADTGAGAVQIAYKTLLPGDKAEFSAPLDRMQNSSNYYKAGLGKRPDVALSAATQVVKINGTSAFPPYYQGAAVVSLAPGQFPTVAESLYSYECLVNQTDCGNGSPLGATMLVIPPDSSSAAQAYMINPSDNYFGTGEMVCLSGPNEFNTIAQAGKWAEQNGVNAGISNRYWDPRNVLTDALSEQYQQVSKKVTPQPSASPTASPAPTNSSSSFKRSAGFDTGRKPLSLGGAGLSWGDEPSNLPSLEEVATTATYAGLSSVIATLARNVMKDLLIAHKKDAAAKAAGKPDEEQSAVADYMFFLGNLSLTLLPALYSSSSLYDAQTKVMSIAMVLAISFGLQLLNKTPQLINGIVAGTAPIALKTLENLIAGNHTLMKDVILMFSALIISSGLAFVTDKLYEPGKAYLRANVYEPSKAFVTNGVGMFASSYNGAKRPISVQPTQEAAQDYRNSFAV